MIRKGKRPEGTDRDIAVFRTPLVPQYGQWQGPHVGANRIEGRCRPESIRDIVGPEYAFGTGAKGRAAIAAATGRSKNRTMQTTHAPPTHRRIVTGAITTAAINGVINGAIQLYPLRDRAPLPLSVDVIINDTHTVLGETVPLAMLLAMILTVIG